MRKVLFVVLSLLVAVDLWAMEKITSSQISGVVVFPQGAIVKRELKVDLKKGENIIKLDDLPMDLVNESVTIDIPDATGLVLSDTKIEKTYLRRVKQERIKELEEKLNKINIEISKYTAELNSLGNSVNFLEKLTLSSKEKLNVSEVDSFLKYVEKALDERYARVLELKDKIKKLEEEKRSIEREISEIKGEQVATKILFITIKSASNREAKMNISYQVNSAGWKPFYELRANTQKGEVEMVYSAMITQSTGEDWKGVTLEVSTARPDQGPLKDLTPWFVDIYKPPPVYKSFDTKEITQFKLGEGIPEIPVVVKEETTSFTFVIQETVTIPSDGKPHKVPIVLSSSDAEFRYIAIPKLSRYAHLRVNTKNPFQFPITRGEIYTYLDGRFTGKMVISKHILSGENLEVSIGMDESLKAERRLVKKFTEYTGLVSKNVRHIYEYEIEIVNGKKRDVSINVKDSIPVSRHEKIVVNLESPKKDEAEISQDGIVSWNLKLKPNEKKTLKIKFSVEYPKDLEVSGLE